MHDNNPANKTPLRLTEKVSSEASIHSGHSHWSNFLNYTSNKSIKKKNSRSKSMYEITENPYADDNCCCCNVTTTTKTQSIKSSNFIYSLFTSSSSSTLSTSSAVSVFLLKFSKLLVSSGAPSHRLDYCLQLLIKKFHIQAQFGYFPGFLVVSLGDLGNKKSSIYFN